MRAILIRHLSALLLLALPAWALSPLHPGAETPPAAAKQPSLAELQDEAEFIVYGTIVRLDLDASDGERYTAIIRPERTWKGPSGKLLTVKGSLYRIGWCGNEHPKSPFQFLASYLVFLKKAPGEDNYQATMVKNIHLPYHRTSPLNSIFGEAPAEISPEETETMELLELLERANGDIAEADRLSSLLDKSRLERDKRLREAETLAKQAEARLAKAQAEFARACAHRDVAKRKALLEKLQESLPSESKVGGMKALKDEITAELSIAQTYSSNGIKEFPASTAP